MLSKTHHALVDGVSGVDISTVLFDTSPDPMPVAQPDHEWVAAAVAQRAPSCSPTRCWSARRSPPRSRAGSERRCAARDTWPPASGGPWAGSAPWRGRACRRRRPAPSTCASAPTAASPGCGETCRSSRRSRTPWAAPSTTWSWPSVAGALGRYLRMHGEATDELVLRAMVPISVRADVERGALGNRVAAMWAPLPIGVTDPVQRLLTISRDMDGIKESGQAVGAQVLTELSGFAPPTIMAQAARLQARQRLFNLVVTNVPGPQFPLYMLGRELDGDVPDGPAGREPGAGHRDHELQRAAQLRPQRRLRRDARPGGAGRRAARLDRGARRCRRRGLRRRELAAGADVPCARRSDRLRATQLS